MRRGAFLPSQGRVLLLPVLALLLLLPSAARAFIVPLPSSFSQPQQASTATTATRLTMAAAADPSASPVSSPQRLFDRAAVLQGLARASGGGGLLLLLAGAGAGASGGGLLLRPAPALAVEVAEEMMVNYESSTKVFSFEYPESWVLAPKPLQTHQEEVCLSVPGLGLMRVGLCVCADWLTTRCVISSNQSANQSTDRTQVTLKSTGLRGFSAGVAVRVHSCFVLDTLTAHIHIPTRSLTNQPTNQPSRWTPCASTR